MRETGSNQMLFNQKEIDAMRAGQRQHDQTLAADRVTAIWKTQCQRKPSSLADTPLFDRQQDLTQADLDEALQLGEPPETIEETFGETIYTYTDAQAIDDGYLVQLVAPNGNDTGHRVTRAAWEELTSFHRAHGCDTYMDSQFAQFFLCEIIPIAPAAIKAWDAGDILKVSNRFMVNNTPETALYWLVPNGAGLTLMKPEDY